MLFISGAFLMQTLSIRLCFSPCLKSITCSSLTKMRKVEFPGVKVVRFLAFPMVMIWVDPDLGAKIPQAIQHSQRERERERARVSKRGDREGGREKHTTLRES